MWALLQSPRGPCAGSGDAGEPAQDHPSPQPMSRRRAFSLQSSGPFHLCAEPHSLSERLLFLVQLEEEKRGFKKIR